MNSWVYKLTGFLCAALCFGNTAYAGISNFPPPLPKPPAAEKVVETKKELIKSKSKSSSKTTAKSSLHSSQKSSAVMHKKANSIASKVSSSVSSKKASISKKSSSKSVSVAKQTKPVNIRPTAPTSTPAPTVAPTPAPAPTPIRTSLVIKKMHPTKKARGKAKLQRGRRGRAGKEGKRGKKGKKGSKGSKGDKGDPGAACTCNNTTAFMSAVCVGTTSAAFTVGVGETVKTFQVINNSDISYNPTTGLFTSTAGPGYYEIHFGASWNGQCAVVLKVDGSDINPFIDLSTPATWARESIIIHTNELSPTFALSNAKSSATSMVLAGKGSYSSAFITIKKIQ